MTSKRDPEAESRGANTPDEVNESDQANGFDQDVEEVPRPDLATAEKADPEEPQPQKPSERQEEKSPACVAPISKIPNIPQISLADIQQDIHVPTDTRPKLPKFVGDFLQGKTVNEFGEIVDERSGQVLARAAGDLPAMAGRKVSNREGDILGDNGEILGYVADLGIERKQSADSGARPVAPKLTPRPTTRSLVECMGQNASKFGVDHFGNILDASGNTVGRFHDNNNPLHRYIRDEEKMEEHKAGEPAASAAAATATEEGVQPDGQNENNLPEKEADQAQEADSGREKPPQRENAQSHRKEDDSPSDIFVDVKSTRDGIQLTIRIPTVFGGQQLQPRVQFS